MKLVSTQVALATDIQPWMEDGECVTSNNPDAWFADNPRDINAAITICNMCPVQRLCLERAMKLEETGIQWGVWGGKSAAERNEIRKKRRQTAEPTVVAVTPKPRGIPGPECGSHGAIKRHRANGELPCFTCVDFATTARRKMRETRRTA